MHAGIKGNINEAEKPSLISFVWPLLDQHCQDGPEPRSLRILERNENLQQKAVIHQKFGCGVNCIGCLNPGLLIFGEAFNSKKPIRRPQRAWIGCPCCTQL
jgi:hypothetical protein